MNDTICILLAEDDEDDVFLFDHALRDSGLTYMLTVVTDGSEVISELSSDIPPDLLFLDINMPRLNGIECFTLVKSTSGLPKIPVIFLSTNTSLKVVKQVEDLGAQGFIMKPNSIDALNHILASVLEIDWTKRKKQDFLFYGRT
ncbi:response regulator [Dyadobacter psychrotolerans]|uniref:Response regulator n=1 Tax=Dyadobacter psychrotolerans TaxID=2541721 RepID=A0A4V2Z4S2_9BACT|nr:response regulator [Dyadobacter psychrotolerans]TDE17368.1 response regulator [Dyadobacter psychrotolerans]